MQVTDRIHVGGTWQRPHGSETTDLVDPFTEEVYARVLALFEPFSAQSQHLGWFDLTLVECDRGHASEDVHENLESPI